MTLGQLPQGYVTNWNSPLCVIRGKKNHTIILIRYKNNSLINKNRQKIKQVLICVRHRLGSVLWSNADPTLSLWHSIHLLFLHVLLLGDTDIMRMRTVRGVFYGLPLSCGWEKHIVVVLYLLKPTSGKAFCLHFGVLSNIHLTSRDCISQCMWSQ